MAVLLDIGLPGVSHVTPCGWNMLYDVMVVRAVYAEEDPRRGRGCLAMPICMIIAHEVGSLPVSASELLKCIVQPREICVQYLQFGCGAEEAGDRQYTCYNNACKRVSIGLEAS